jgi:hypothetical protein
MNDNLGKNIARKKRKKRRPGSSSPVILRINTRHGHENKKVLEAVA